VGTAPQTAKSSKIVYCAQKQYPLWTQIYTKVQFFLDKKAVRLYY